MKNLGIIILIFTCIFTHAQSPAPRFQNAVWITPGYTEDTLHATPPVFRKTFNANPKVKSAILYITCLGLYEGSINGFRIGDAYFTPGWTSYDHRLQYQQYDVTKFIRSKNELQVTVGEGWYRGAFGANMEKNFYGKQAGLLVELVIIHKNERQQIITSDSTWLSGTGPIIYSGIYEGELYDSRKSTKQWMPVKILQHAKDILIPSTTEPVRKQETFTPKKIFTTPHHDQIIDFGQNLSGWVQIKVNGNAGDTIKVSHAEVLDKEGNFYTGNLRKAKAQDIYILRGGPQTLEPHFTFHGFRYIKVEGIKTPLDPKDVKAIALYSDLQQSGTFTSSDSFLNRLQQNINWSLKGNFLDIPTDCPQRSERFGWTGDAQVFVSTAAYNRNVKLFFEKWLKDLAADQGKDGSVPRIIPDFYSHRDTASKGGVAGWSDAATIIPWTLFEYYGDTNILRNQYPSMKSWVDYITKASENYLWTANGYGDWLAPGEKTELPYIDQCFYAHSAELLINAAKVLNKQDDLQYYTELLHKVKQALLNEYFTPDGRCVTNTQTAYVLELHFNLLPEAMRPKAAKRLSELIRSNENHLATGFLGTPYLLQVLSDNGYTDLAFTLLKQETYPSWLYPVTMDATTIWERWDGILPDSNVQATSYNHYAYGAVGDWFYRTIGGIQPAAPGFKKIIIKPHIGGGLTYANTSYKSIYGEIVSNWKIIDGKLIMDVTIPKNITAIILTPNKKDTNYDKHEVEPGHYHYSIDWSDDPVTFIEHPEWNFTVTPKKQLTIEPPEFPSPEKLFILSDIEGEFGAFRKLMINNHVIDSNYNWTFGNGHLAICGDLFDRGQHVTELLQLLYTLEDDAKSKGGYVHVILGNHDIMNLSGDLRYVQPQYFAEAKTKGKDYRDLYSINTELGRWLRTKNIIEKIGNNLYLHAGISQEINRLNMSLQEINNRVRPYYDQPIKEGPLSVFFNGESSPFWYRGYFIEPFATGQQVDSTLQLYQCEKIIVGHTITEKNIASYYNGKVIGIDVDYHEGKHQALMIEGSRFFVVDDNGHRREVAATER